MPPIAEKPRDEALYRIRHSLSHVMAQAVQKLFPGTRLGFGPPIDDGFYYDYLFPPGVAVGAGELGAIEEEMRSILQQGQEFERLDLPPDEAFERLEEMGEPHKLEYARELVERGRPLSFYKNGPFVDLCRGPHVPGTGRLGHFALMKVADFIANGFQRLMCLGQVPFGHFHGSTVGDCQHLVPLRRGRLVAP